MRSNMRAITIVAALLTLSATAAAQTAPHKTEQVYVVRTVFFTASPRRLPRFPVTVTDAPGKVTLPPVVEAATLLDGGQMGTALFAAELKKLEASGAVKVGSRPFGVVGAGGTLNLSSGAEIPVAVAGLDDKGRPRSTTTGYLINGGRLNVKVEELGDGDTYTVDVEAESAEPDAGTVQLASIKTRLEMRRGKTFIFKLGASPDNNSRENYFAVGVEPAPPLDVRAR
jgi:hypothetical protein